MKKILAIVFSAFLMTGVFAQTTAATPAPEVKKEEVKKVKKAKKAKKAKAEVKVEEKKS